DGQRYRQCFRCGKDDDERNQGHPGGPYPAMVPPG
ncbi:MAG: hypothetical protein QOI76_294, partial [Frankiales bacterium]|nr:hypothetical protein [Frankiales bacterium]